MTIRANARRAGLISALFACGMVFAADPANNSPDPLVPMLTRRR